jgi:Uma2 family endonuclease
MPVVVAGHHPEVDALIERRRALGLDGNDEMWEGVYHVAPHAHASHGRIESRLIRLLTPFADAAGLEVTGAFNLGLGKDSYRVPDMGVREPGDALYMPSAAVVIEILSPDDETFEKFDYYAERKVAEIFVVDPDAHTIRGWRLIEGRFRSAAESEVLGVAFATLEETLRWP